MLALMLACGSSDPAVVAPSTSAVNPIDILTRVSMDIRGVRPSVADVDTILADPDALDDLIDDYLSDASLR